MPGASVRILDLDTGGNGNDVILETVTDGQGRFGGMSKEWQDVNNQRITIPFVGTQVVPVPDVLILQFQVNSSGRTHSGPFIRVSDTVSAPIVCPWLPDINPFGQVDGQPCVTIQDFRSKLRASIDGRKSSIDVVVYDASVVVGLSVLAIQAQLRELVRGRLGFFPSFNDVAEDILVTTTLGIAFLMLTAGVGTNMMSVLLSLFYASVSGYRVDAEKRTENNKDVLAFKLTKRI
jgi:hypothetical protein